MAVAQPSLAKRLCKAWSSLPEGERDVLEEMKAHSAGKPEESSLVDMVRKLGHYPRRYKDPADDAQKAEDSLAQRLCKSLEAWRGGPQK